jgi:hypothetical protein
MRLASGDRLPDTLLGLGTSTDNWSNLSNLASRNSIIRDFGGGTSDEMKGFDALQQVGDRHYLTGLGRWVSRSGNNPYDVIGPAGIPKGPKSDKPSTMPATLPSKGEMESGLIDQIRDFFRRRASDRDKQVYGPDGSTTEECPACCKEFLFGSTDAPDRLTWCEQCCDAHTEYYLVPEQCAEIGLIISISACRGRCCYPNIPSYHGEDFVHLVSNAMDNDPACLNSMKELLDRAIEDFRKAYVYYQWAQALEDCLKKPWIEAIDCIRKLLKDHPDGENILTTILQWLNDNAPNYLNVNACCQAIANALAKGDNDDNIQCCQEKYSYYIGSSGGLDEDYVRRFINSIYCCFMCASDDPHRLDQY